MAISAVDVQNDYVPPDILPQSRPLIILCNEICLIPDTISCKPLISLDVSTLPKNGIFSVRYSSELQKGIIIGHLFSCSSSFKLFTPYREHYLQFIPVQNLEYLNLLKSEILPKSPSASPGQDSSCFDEIYSETISKYSKTFLLESMVRAAKMKSAKAQIRNIAQGVAISLNTKNGAKGYSKVDLDEITEAMYSDLENHQMIVTNLPNIEYNSEIIEVYFGRNKSRIFMPAHKGRRESPERREEIKVERKEEKKEVVRDLNPELMKESSSIQSGYNPYMPMPGYPQPGYPQHVQSGFNQPGYPPQNHPGFNQPGFSPPAYYQGFYPPPPGAPATLPGLTPVYNNFQQPPNNIDPYLQGRGPADQYINFNSYSQTSSTYPNKVNPPPASNISFPSNLSFNSQLFPNSPDTSMQELKQSVQSLSLSVIKPIQCNFSLEDFTSYLIEEHNKNNPPIPTCLHLWRFCNSHLRLYSEGKGISEEARDEYVRKSCKMMLDTYYKAETPLDNETLSKDLSKYGPVKVTLLN